MPRRPGCPGSGTSRRLGHAPQPAHPGGEPPQHEHTDLAFVHKGHKALPVGSVEVRAGETIVHKEHGVSEAIIIRVLLEDGLLRRDLSRSVFAKQCAIRIDKQQKERHNNVVIDNDVII